MGERTGEDLGFEARRHCRYMNSDLGTRNASFPIIFKEFGSNRRCEDKG